jgi:hypothetical protein
LRWGSHYIAKPGLNLSDISDPPISASKKWDYMCLPPALDPFLKPPREDYLSKDVWPSSSSRPVSLPATCKAGEGGTCCLVGVHPPTVTDGLWRKLV